MQLLPLQKVNSLHKKNKRKKKKLGILIRARLLLIKKEMRINRKRTVRHIKLIKIIFHWKEKVNY
jgi:hypothetical protein